MKRIVSLFLVLTAIVSTTTAQTVIHSENFNTNTAGTWTAVDVASATDIWRFTAGYAQINGFGDEDDLDWLISPAINMDNSTNETFTFKTKNRYAGAASGPAPTINLELKYTTNYTGDPSTTTWTNITLPATVASSNNTTTTLSAQTTHAPFDISSIAGTNVRFAFRYYGTAAASKEWQIDDIEIAGAVACTAPTTQATSLSASASNSSVNISWVKGDGSNTLVLINTTNSFTAPVDGTTYTANTVYAGGQQVVYTNTSTSVTVTGLSASTTYYVQVYNFQTCSSPIDYVTSSPLSGSFTTSAAMDCATFRTSVKAGLPTHTDLGYNTARSRMYGNCDNINNSVTCIYGGYTQAHPYGSVATSISLPNGRIINAEHTVPQSFFGGGDAPMVSDMCHLFPTYETWNSDRGNSPFAEIPDAQTTKWERLLDAPLTSIPSSNINEYSEYTSGSYEPREIQKGNTARAIFYFYTVYETQMNTTYSHPIGDVADVQTLYNWHIQDPVTQADIDRNNCIKTYQGNGNPYIDHPEWVAQAFGCGIIIPVEMTVFEGKNQGTYNALTWETATEKNADYFSIERKDNEKWGEIGRVKAHGNTVEKHKYSFDDLKPNPLSIYRLRTVDADGKELYSKMITIENVKKAFSLKMFPNPSKDYVTFRATTADKQAFDIKITDVTGRVLMQRNYPIESGIVEEHINISTLPAGLYFFTFDNGTYKTVEQFVKAN
ncbi:MAG: endonuclease [Saprospiraceae bacterium]|nr:endonuclease [Saprospiraceae bacterium]